jgi:hypothetical protein
MTVSENAPDDSLGSLLSDAETSAWQGMVSLPRDEWVRLGETDYEVRQHSDVGVWLAQWKVGRLSVRTRIQTSTDIVRVDLGEHFAFAPVIADGMSRTVYDSTLPNSHIKLTIRYAPPNPVEMSTAVGMVYQVYGVVS